MTDPCDSKGVTRSVLVAVIAWLSVVVAGSTMTWATINTAGQEVLSPATVPTARAVDGSTGSPGGGPRKSGEPGRRTPSPSDGPTREDPTRSPDPSPSPTAPAASPTRSDAGDGPRNFTWRGSAGSVTVVCDGRTISLQAASPNNGYSVEVRERGPQEVEVRLRSDDEEARVEAFCASGRAQFNVTL